MSFARVAWDFSHWKTGLLFRWKEPSIWALMKKVRILRRLVECGTSVEARNVRVKHRNGKGSDKGSHGRYYNPRMIYQPVPRRGLVALFPTQYIYHTYTSAA